jgi:hypothetical protein
MEGEHNEREERSWGRNDERRGGRQEVGKKTELGSAALRSDLSKKYNGV